MPLAGTMDLRGIVGGMTGVDAGYGLMTPSPEDMQREMDAVLYNKKVLVDDFKEQTFDLSNRPDRAAYRKLVIQLSNGVAQSTHLMTAFDRKFVERPTPRWIVHMEWVVYRLIVTPNPTVQPRKDRNE